MADLPDDLLKRIIEGSGRVYTHEAKAMAAEIVRWRTAAKKAVAAAQQQQSASNAGPWTTGAPYP